jgi:hypothetical protein
MSNALSIRPKRTRRRGAWPLVFLALAAATAQPEARAAQRRLEVSGSMAVTEAYDDNVLAIPDDQRRDTVSRVAPRLGVGYWSPRFDVRVHYSREAEAFRRTRELSTLSARQDGGLDLRWSPGGGFEAAGRAYYGETHSPGEFAFVQGLDPRGMQLIGLELRRTLARRLSTVASLSRRLGARTRITAEHGFAQDQMGGLTGISQTVAARLDRRVGPVDSLSLAYGMRQFTALGQVNSSHAATVTWSREVTPRAHIELQAGARLSDRQVDPELGARLRHRFRRGDVALSYVQTETVIIGRPTPVKAKELSATLTRPLGRTFTVTAGPNLLEAHGKAMDVVVYGTSLELTCRLGRYVSLAGTHRLSFQNAELDGRPRTEMAHNTVLLRLVAGSGN